MKQNLGWLCVAALINIGISTGCKARKPGSVPANSAVPASTINRDSTSTTPSAKLTPSPVPNNRPKPKPDPMPPDP
jgi:hypothetical protein